VTAAVEMLGIRKVFPGVVANDNVDLSVEEGEIHALIGENGAQNHLDEYSFWNARYLFHRRI